MSADDPIDKGKSAIVGELVKEVADSPKIREAGSQLAQAALTVSKTINVCLLPLAALNFGYEKARQYFNNEFTSDIGRKTADIPLENIVEPKATIAGPALQGLAFSHEEPSLKEMYLNILKSSMDNRTSGFSHPSFVEIVRQLSSDEAKLLKRLLPLEGYRPIVEVRLVKPSGDKWHVIMRHLIPYVNFETGVEVEYAGISAMFDNFLRLGLIHVTYSSEIKIEGAYDWAEKRPEVARFRKELEADGDIIKCVHGISGRTAFGKQFAEAVGII